MQLKKPTIGPILGARTYGTETVDQTVTVRGRDQWADQTCFLHLASDDGRVDKIFTVAISNQPRTDFIGKFTLQGLAFDTNYKYRVGIVEGWHTISDVQNATFKGGIKGSFSTSNPGHTVTRFVFGSCCHFSLPGLFTEDPDDNVEFDDAAFKRITDQWVGAENIRDDFIMMLGDQIYGDHHNENTLRDQVPIADKEKLTLEHYLSHYRTAFAKPYKRKVMASIPTYMTFDDHEVHNNWGSKRFLDEDKEDYRVLKDALDAYQLYQVSHPDVKPPKSDDIAFGKALPEARYYYEFSHGKSDFFVLDTRYEKRPHQANLRMISDAQMSALKTFLDRGQSRVKFIVSSVPMLPDSDRTNAIKFLDASPEDRWEGYEKQRKEILDHVKQNSEKGVNPNVIVLSGDVHVSYAFSLSSNQSDDFQMHQITSSAFSWHIGLQNKNFRKKAPLGGTENEYKPKNLSGRFIKHDNFCRVSVKTNKVDIEFHHARSGKLLKSVTIDLVKPAIPA